MNMDQSSTPMRRSDSLQRLALGFGLILMAVLFQAKPAQASEGEKLHQKQCASCHNGMFPGGKGEMIYAPDFRKITAFKPLRQRVETCANRTNAGWFDEEVDAVTQWLNQSFYRFAQAK